LDPSLGLNFASPLDASPQATAVKVKD